MSLKKILIDFLNGERDLEISNARAELPTGECGQFEGIISYKDGNLSIAASDANLNMFQVVGSTMNSDRGELISSKNHIRISGKLPGNITIESEDGYAASSSSNATFTFTMKSVVLSFPYQLFETAFEGAFNLKGKSLLYRPPPTTRDSIRRYYNSLPVWFRTLSSSQAELSIGSIDSFKPYIIGLTSKGMLSTEKLSSDLLLSIGFLRGQRLEWIYKTLPGFRDKVMIYSQRPSNEYYVFQYPQNDRITQAQEDELLIATLNWCHANETTHIESCLEVFWSTSSIPSVEALSIVLSVVVESITKYLWRIGSIEYDYRDDADLTATRQRAIALIEELRGSNHFSRIAGAIGGRPKEYVNDLLLQVAGITSREVSVWEQHRHKPVHGNFEDFTGESEEQRQLLFDDQNVLIGLVHKLLFRLFGYSGGHTDYSTREWNWRIP